MWSDDLTLAEANYMDVVLKELSSTSWARRLLDRLDNAGGICSQNKPELFKARFAYELHRAGASAAYEFAAGVGDSTVDFLVHGDTEWLVELVSLRETKALKSAIQVEDGFYSLSLQTGAANEDESEEAEMIRALMKIGEKVCSNGGPTKFPVPNGRVHMVLIDTRGYCGHGGDAGDFIQMASGARELPNDASWMTHYWNGHPIRGLFEVRHDHPLRAAHVAQERLHYIGFVAEKKYEPGEIRFNTYYRANPILIHSNEELVRVARTFPLYPGR